MKDGGEDKNVDENEGVIGERQKKRKYGSTGLSRGKQVDNNLLQCVGLLTDHVGTMAESIKNSDDSQHTGVTRDGVADIVRCEVEKVVQNAVETSSEKMIAKFGDMLQGMFPGPLP